MFSFFLFLASLFLHALINCACCCCLSAGIKTASCSQIQEGKTLWLAQIPELINPSVLSPSRPSKPCPNPTPPPRWTLPSSLVWSLYVTQHFHVNFSSLRVCYEDIFHIYSGLFEKQKKRSTKNTAALHCGQYVPKKGLGVGLTWTDSSPPLHFH